jgi:branched-chain amino acid transport system permease protein
MSQIIVDSLITGAVYMVMALGLVAVFKTARVFNFAHGQMAALSGYIAYQISIDWHVPFIVLVLAGVATGALTAFLAEKLILSRLYHRTMLELVVATFGISLILRAVIQRIWAFDTRTIPTPFPGTNVHLLGTTFSAYGALVIGIGIAIVLALSVVLNRTALGLMLRATFDDPVAARLTGIGVSRVRTLSWLVGGALAGLGGVLLTPLVYLTSDTMDTVLIVAFAAAVVGGFSSLYGAVAGGFLVAFGSNIVANYISLTYRNVFVYVGVLVFLWIRPEGLFGKVEGEQAAQEGERVSAFTRMFASTRSNAVNGLADIRRVVLRGWAPQWGLLALVIAAIFIAPSLFGRTNQLNLITWLVDVVAVAGLVVTSVYGGRLSLAQPAFMAIGAYSMPHLLNGHGSRWPLALVGAALIAGAVGLVFEIPSLRLEGAYYCVATLALALIVPLVADQWRSITGGVNGISVPYASWDGSLLNFATIYRVFAFIVVGLLLVLLALRNSPVGRAVVAVRDSPGGAASLGIAAGRRKVAASTLGATLGGLAGGMLALENNVVTGTQFGLSFALTLFVASVLAGSMLGAAWGAAVIVLIPVALSSAPLYATGLFGVILILTLFFVPRGRDASDVLRRIRPAAAAGAREASVAAGAPAAANRERGGQPPVLPSGGRSSVGKEPTRRA